MLNIRAIQAILNSRDSVPVQNGYTNRNFADFFIGREVEPS